MVFLQPEYFKLFFLLVLLVPLWLFYFFTKRNARKRLGAAGPVQKISHLHSLWRAGTRYLLINLALVALVFALATLNSYGKNRWASLKDGRGYSSRQFCFDAG